MKTDKTIREYLEMMDEPERSQAIENANTDIDEISLFVNCTQHAISGCMNWSETPQGIEYWGNIYDKYHNR